MPYSELVAIFPAFCRRCYGSLYLTLCVLALNAWLLPAAIAQPAPPVADQTASHRRLPLPSHGTPDLQQQMFLMKQLKALLSGQSATPPDKTAADNPEQNRVQDALQALKDKLPPELRPMLDNVPPALVEQAMSDPAIKEQMKQVLEQYSKNREIPQGNSQNGSRLPLPPSGPPPSDASPRSESQSRPSEPERSGRPDAPKALDRSSEPPQLASDNPSANVNDRNGSSPARPQGNPPQSPNQPGADQGSRMNAGSDAAAEPISEPETTKPPNEAAEAAESALQKLRKLWNRQLGNNPETPPDNSSSAQPPGDFNSAPQDFPAPGNGRFPSTSPPNSSGQPGSSRQPNSSGQPGSSEQRQPAAERGSSQRRGSADVAENGGQHESPDEWDRRIENLIRQQRGEPPLPSPPAGASRSAAPGAASGDRGRSVDTAEMSERSTGKPSVAEFLELMQGVIPADPQPPMDSTADASNAGPNAGAASDAEERERLSEQVRRKQQDAKQDLQQLGLQETLKKIVKGAKQDAQQQQIAAQQNSNAAQQDRSPESATDEAAGGMSESMLKALGGISRDLIEIVKDARFTPADEQQAGGRKSAAAEPAQPSVARSLFNDLRDTTTELLADIEEPPAPRAATTADDVPSDVAVPTSLADLVAQWLLPVLLVAVLLMLLLWRSGVIAAPSIGGGAMSRVAGDDVQSKADVVRAFHRMALQPTRATQHWWTHQMVADDIREASPDKEDQVRILARLYEQARYLPEDADFTPEQIREAQTALKRCET